MSEDPNRSYRNSNRVDASILLDQEHDSSMTLVGALLSHHFRRNHEAGRRNVTRLRRPSQAMMRRQQLRFTRQSGSTASGQRIRGTQGVSDLLNEALHLTGAPPPAAARSNRTTARGLNNNLTLANVFPSMESPQGPLAGNLTGPTKPLSKEKLSEILGDAKEIAHQSIEMLMVIK